MYLLVILRVIIFQSSQNENFYDQLVALFYEQFVKIAAAADNIFADYFTNII